VKIVCGKCSAEVELPKEGESPDIKCPSCGAVFHMPSLADGEELPHPEAFPGYRIVAIIGHGGMGTVYRAIQLSLDREVAIKVLLRKYADVPRFVSRFEREASALAALNHPHIVAVIDRGRVEDMYYLVMEYVHGRTLRYFIKSDLLSVERCVEIAMEVCQALEAAHAQGIVHRDIKPGNILVQEDGPVKVADFGIAHMLEANDHSEGELRARLGTAKYMAPEQRGTGDGIDPRADIYALGITLHEMLARSLPKGEPPSAFNKLVPPALDSIVEQATQEDREQRFRSAAQAREALEALLASMRLERTPATEALAAPLVPTAPCPACGQEVSALDATCPHCGGALREPCYRPDCEGTNPLGAERCATCGGQLELLKRQRRDELEALLQQADAHLAAGYTNLARLTFTEVASDHHADFAPLRERATDALRTVRRERIAAVAGSVATAVVAFLVVVLAGIAAYWGVSRFLARPPAPTQEPQPPEPPETPQATSTAVVAPPQEREPAGRHRAFRDYLVALTADEWTRQPPAVRLRAACEAARYMALRGRDRAAGERLASVLEAVARARVEGGTVAAPSGAELDRMLAAALDELCGVIAGELRGETLLAAGVERTLGRHQGARRRASDPRARMALASTTLHRLLAGAEITLNPDLDLDARLLFLDASLDGADPQDGLRNVADRLRRSGRLLVRYLRRQNGAKAVRELLDDAAARAARARRESHDTARMACALEALIEALAATTGGE